MNEQQRLDRVEAIIAEIKPLAAEYYQLTHKPLGVTGEVAEYIAAEKLSLKLSDARNPGHDAIQETADGQRHIQIKGRVFGEKINPGAKLSRINKEKVCHAVLLVILRQENLELREIWEAPFSEVKSRLEKAGKARERGVLSVAEFRKLATKIWPPAGKAA